MSTSSQTHWPLFLDAIAQGKLALGYAEMEVLLAEACPLFNRRRFDNVLRDASNCPRFVIDTPVSNLIWDQGIETDFADMHRCGTLRLPFPRIVVEYCLDAREGMNSDITNSVMIEEIGPTKWAALYLSTCTDGAVTVSMTDSYCCIFSFENTGSNGFQIELKPAAFMDSPDDPFFEKNIAFGETTSRMIVHGFRCAMAVIQSVGGLAQSPSKPTPLANKLRKKRGRAPIPAYTLIHLAPKNIVAANDDDKSTEPFTKLFLRRGHARRVACGPGRTERRWHWFPAQVVGYREDGTKPSVEEMQATRAVDRPYLKVA